jgi:hypothetical protein
MPTIDHLVVTAATREAGAAHVRASLGAPMGPGGAHAEMGTHNRLLSLDGSYLEAIAVDPAAPAPPHARWFGLDAPPPEPALRHWVLRVGDLEGAAAALPGSGRIRGFARDGLRWRMAVPEDGRLPFDGCAPALMRWDVGPPEIAGSGLSLGRLVLRHPEPAALGAALAALGAAGLVEVESGPPGLLAEIATPSGGRLLQ